MTRMAGIKPQNPESGLLELFGTVVSRYPRRIAVSAPDGELTYQELDRRAGLLAGVLRRAGVGTDTVVPVLGASGIPLLVGLLAVLKAGGAYLPVDPGSPPERIRRLIDGCGAQLVAATAKARSRLGDSTLPVVPLDGPDPEGPPAQAVPGPHDLAYVIYTSGSTGEPKAVTVEHASIARLLTTTRSLFGLDQHDVWTMFHSAAFDFSVWEIWGAWSTGARLVVVPYEVSRSPARFRQLVSDEAVTVLSQTPSAFRQFVAADATADRQTKLRLVVLGGERLDVALLAPWFDRNPPDSPRLVNMFGITETTVHASYRWIEPGDLDHPAVSPIGVPLPYLSFRVMNEDGEPVPDGEPGELYIAGPGVARGYLNRPDLTARRFLTLAGGQRFYRSGDRVRLRADGYSYLGRIDDQLSVRGFRVEPREVEAVLEEHAEVGHALVTTSEHGGGDVRLAAYVTPPPGAAAGDPWRSRIVPGLIAHTAARLPRHLRPSEYLPVEAIPLTSNGKADRSPITGPPAPDDLADSEVRAGIIRIWQQTLGHSAFGEDDDFFDLGGTSLSVLRMFGQVNDEFQTDLDLTALVDGVSVASLAAEVERARISRSPLAEADR
ncbi:non-ribosomal peptide synthetase [Kineosporia sp. J2-2]|uniref:Non-ribosomal peptide synthetase n=1 Tax=Kineosporia corallincola TaxID=2835133 RepID=A0ABS5TRR7_9ACTN|nr:non-ribosomal peptide synthetase [Kineosporia corallincola]MBT0773484.1 non-ribosomal peptide synthetase [Kineosporia corallincola]